MRLGVVLLLATVLLCAFGGSDAFTRRRRSNGNEEDTLLSPRIRRSSKSGSSKSGSSKSSSSKSPKSSSSKSPKSGSSKSSKSSPKSPDSSKSSSSSKTPDVPVYVPKVPETTTTKPTTTTTTTTTLATTTEKYRCINHTLINKPYCKDDPEPRPCKSLSVGYYFDKTASDCVKFEEGQCGRNRNNFKTYEECRDHCPRAYCHKDGCDPETMQCAEAGDNMLFCYVEEIQCTMCKCSGSSELVKKMGVN